MVRSVKNIFLKNSFVNPILCIFAKKLIYKRMGLLSNWFGKRGVEVHEQELGNPPKPWLNISPQKFTTENAFIPCKFNP